MSRYTIEISDEVDKQIEEMASALNASTKAEVLRKALGLLNYVTKERADGGTLILENQAKSTRKEIVTL